MYLNEIKLRQIISKTIKKYISESFRGEMGLKNIGENSEQYIGLQNAKIMQQNNEPPLKIKQTTGWEIGYDGKWKYEGIDGFIKKTPIGQIHVLSDMWEDDDLYKWYPNLKNVKIIINKNGDTYTSNDGSYISISKGFFWTTDDFSYNTTIYTQQEQIEELEKAIQHEIQHLIQIYEKWEHGAKCPNTFLAANLWQKIEFVVKKMVEITKNLTKEEIKQLYKKCQNKDERQVLVEILSYVYNGYTPNDYLADQLKDLENIKKYNEKLGKEYRNNNGEKEAYEVNNRYGWDYNKRRNNLIKK